MYGAQSHPGTRAPVLEPQPRAPEVVDERVEVVLRRAEPERDRIPERGEHPEPEHDRDGLPQRLPQRREALPQPHADVASPTGVDGERRTDDGEGAEQPPTAHPVEGGERPEDEDQLHPTDDIRGEEERRGRTRREQAGDAQRSERQQRGAREEGEGPRHCPLAEKCW